MGKILITGSGGLVGSEAVEFYCSEGYEVVGIDNNYREYFFGKSGSIQWRIEELSKYKNYKHYNSDIVNFKEQNRIGDHMWWVSDITKFQKHFPEWKQQYNLEKIMESFLK